MLIKEASEALEEGTYALVQTKCLQCLLAKFSCFLAIYPDVILPVQLDSSGMPVDAKFQILLLVRGVGVGGVKMR
jgi:hypothetical protein